MIEDKMTTKADYYENFDLENIITPVNYKILHEVLTEAKYDEDKTRFLVEGFRRGFSIEYKGPKIIQQEAPNLKIRIGTEVDLWNKVMKEVKMKRYAGPFSEVPFQNYIQSPIGLVPKDKGKSTRLIFHLSYPRNSQYRSSVNAHTPRELCKVQYKNIDDAIRRILQEGNSPFAGKSDLSAAFRQAPLSVDQFCWLVMKARSPFDGKIYWFMDKCLPFGSSISCSLYQKISDSLAHVMQYRSNGKIPVNYLDDFLFIAMLKCLCDGQVQMFIDLCKQIGLPVAMEKTEWSSEIITFLGLLLNLRNHTISLPVEKIEKARAMIDLFLKHKKVTIHTVQQLCGYLNFLCKAIVPGRSFTTRLYAPLKIKDKNGELLKQHHHVKITTEMKLDLALWRTFLESPDAYSRPFIDMTGKLNAKELSWYTDSAKNGKLGFGGFCVKKTGCLESGDMTLLTSVIQA